MRIILLLPLFLTTAFLVACARPDRFVMATPNITLDLDSLHRANLHQDSVESNHFFYEQAYEEYRERFLGVDKPSYMRIAKGKDKEFCLFRPNPATTCQAIGDKLDALGLGEPARDAYEAGLLSEGVNGSRMNVRLWASLAKIHFERREFDRGEAYLAKVLEVEPKNREAKKLLASASRQKSKG